MTKPISQYDQSFIARDTHDEAGHFVRVADATSIANRYFTHFRATYNDIEQPTLVNYYQGTSQQKTELTCAPDVNSSLAGKYFTFNSAPDNKLYYIYVTVDGTGTDPEIANATGYAVDIEENDLSIVVAAAINFRIQSSLSSKFKSSRTGPVVQIFSLGFGLADASTVGTLATFSIQNTLGDQTLTNSIAIEYSDSNNPNYQGQELKGMYFNVSSGKFETANSSTPRLINLADYLFQDLDDTGTGTSYSGNVAVDGKYLIKRIVETGPDVQVRYANISNNGSVLTYADAWTSRASLVFNYIHILSNI